MSTTVTFRPRPKLKQLQPEAPSRLEIPLAFKPRKRGGIGHLHPGLTQTYNVDPSIGRQARWRNRAKLVPELDLSAFTAKAVIDWIDIRVESSLEIEAKELSEFLRVNLGKALWAAGPDGGKGYSGQCFDVRLHDPTPQRLRRLIRTIKDEEALTTDGEVAAIEVSVDWYPKSSSESERLLMTDLLWRHLLPPNEVCRVDHGWPRSVFGRGQGAATKLLDDATDEMASQPRIYAGVVLPPDAEQTRTLDLKFHRQPAVDGTTCWGPERGDAHIRVMHKVMDQQDRRRNTKVELDEKERRARIEVTLRGGALQGLGLKWTRELGAIDFEGLAPRYFQFWLPTMRHHQGPFSASSDLICVLRGREELDIFSRTGVFGLDEYQWARRAQKNQARRKLSYRGATRKERDRTGQGKNRDRIAYTELNERIYDALRRLRWEP